MCSGDALELGERRDRLAAVVGVLVVDLEQQGLVGLDDQGSVGHSLPSLAVLRGYQCPTRDRLDPNRRHRRGRHAASGRGTCDGADRLEP